MNGKPTPIFKKKNSLYSENLRKYFKYSKY